MARKTNIVLFKQYPTYQACFDIYSDKISVDNIYKKTFLYIINWLKARIGESKIDQIPDLKKYPDISCYKEFDVKDMRGFKLLAQTDIRLFNLEKDNSWAMKIVEPDNRAEFKSGAMNDAAEISGRSFITEVGLKNNKKYISLAVRIGCREPVDNARDAMSFRPAFVNSIYKDEELIITESGVDKQFAFLKTYNDDNAICGIPIVIDNDNSYAFIKQLLCNPVRQMPIILCPESVKKQTYTSVKYVAGDKIEKEGDINTFAYSLMGYAHVVIVSDAIVENLFAYKKSKCVEYGDVLQDENIIFHQGFDEENGLPYEPRYISIEEENENNGKNAAEDSVEDETITESSMEKEIYDEDPPLFQFLELAKKYSVRKNFRFNSVKFYRELKKDYYKYEGKNDISEAISNLEHENSEKELLINDLSSTLEYNERESRRRIDELKSKFSQCQLKAEEYKTKYLEEQKINNESEGKYNAMVSKYKETIRQKDLMISLYSKAKIPEPSYEMEIEFYKEKQKVLFDCDDRYKESFIKDLIIKKIKEELTNIYWRLKEEYRRHLLIEILIQYNDFLEKNNLLQNELLYYPPGFELYDGEFRDVIFDALYEKSEKDEFLNMILEYNDFDYAQNIKKEELTGKLNGYRQHKNIEAVIKRAGFVLKSSSGHYIYSYYGDERYKITVAGSPSDTNAGKNLAERIIELCL